MKKFIFFTNNDFSKASGGTIRMSGILNALASSGQDVTLISNTILYNYFHPAIKHINLDNNFSKKKKKIFQFFLIFFPKFINKYIFKELLLNFKKLKKSKNIILDVPIIFFEHLDNSIALFLKTQKVISGYINDLHGIAKLEFKDKKPIGFLNKIDNYFKYIFSCLLDKKMYLNSNGLIFLSEDMKNYLSKEYSFILYKKNFILPDGISQLRCNNRNKINYNKNLKKYFNISKLEKIIMFAGNFKYSGGVLDLIDAFNMLIKNHNISSKLVLIGEGECIKSIKNKIQKYSLNESVILTGRVSYSELDLYYQMADIIVCPDIQNLFSDMVVHIKYFEALASNKVVISGSFNSTNLINIDEKLSVNFKPSNIFDLFTKLKMVIEYYDKYKTKYLNNKNYICHKFSYDNNISDLIKNF